MVSLARLSSRLQPTLLTLRLRRALIHLNPAQTVSANSSRTLAGTAALNAEPAAAPPRLRQCCGRGALHEGTPVGKVEMVGDIETYVSLPQGEYDRTTAVIYLTDVFGISGNLPNNLLLADSFAARGLPVFMPDILNGDAVPATAMNDPDLDLDGWFARHGPDTTRPALDKVIAALRAQGVTRITAVAYCFGARSMVALLAAGEIECAVVAHPSLLTLADLQAVKDAGRPVLWNLAENDEYFTPEMQDIADGVFGGDTRFERRVWAGTGHGFATRGNAKVDSIRRAKEGAFGASVEWLRRHM